MNELDLENSLNISSSNIEEVFKKMFKRLGQSYKVNPCENGSCDWYEDCRIIKWIWFYPTNNVTSEQKLKDYCRFKKVTNNALYEGIVEVKIV
ncbi:MAG: hypothetical protein H7Y18_00725 [Clostridiaceae bacterium]|nr:hypothetical protein [Clostridiaceae bacterium]